MNRHLIRALAALALAIPVATAVDLTPVSATVSKPCTTSWYTGPARMFVRCSAGTQYSAFKARIGCSNGHTYDGPWQSLPGPWYGSLAACPAGTSSTSGTILYLG